MGKIAEMSGSKLRALLEIDSVVDKPINVFDRWDNRHPGRDFYDAENQREYLIEQFYCVAEEASSDDSIKAIVDSVEDFADAYAIASEVVRWHNFSCVDLDDFEAPEDYNGLDGFVYASRLQLAHVIWGDFEAEEDELRHCFDEDYEEPY